MRIATQEGIYNKMSLVINDERVANLIQLSQVVVNQTIQYKLDKIADIYINNIPYFTVFRRFNSVYEYVIEDANGDNHLHKNSKVRDSLKSILCLSDQQMSGLYVTYAFSYKRNEPLDSTTTNLAENTWSDISKKYGAVCINVGGILLDYHACNGVDRQMYSEDTSVKEESPAMVNSKEEQWSILVPRSTHSLPDTRERNVVYYYEEGVEDYMVLRSGVRVPKIHVK